MALIAYFDYLGFKDFIERNDTEYHDKIIKNIFRDIENAMGKGKTQETSYGVIADLSQLSINCINFSDTVIFWTDEDDINKTKDLLDIAFRFNWMCIDFFFPVRGCIVFDDILLYKHDYASSRGGTYVINSIFGKGLVKAHLKAEDQNWAGTVIDVSVIDFLEANGINAYEFLQPYAKQYKVPYKTHDNEEEWVLNLVTSNGKMNDEAFTNISRNIAENFSAHNKRTDIESVQIKLKNTIAFLESYR